MREKPARTAGILGGTAKKSTATAARAKLPPAKAGEVLPVPDRCAGLMQAAAP